MHHGNMFHFLELNYVIFIQLRPFSFHLFSYSTTFSSGTFICVYSTDFNGNVTRNENMTLRNYTIYTLITSCRFWNESTEKWETTGTALEAIFHCSLPTVLPEIYNSSCFHCIGCSVSSETDSSKVVCFCEHLTSFGAGFIVAPNPIDFASLSSKIQVCRICFAVLVIQL